MYSEQLHVCTHFKCLCYPLFLFNPQFVPNLPRLVSLCEGSHVDVRTHDYAWNIVKQRSSRNNAVVIYAVQIVYIHVHIYFVCVHV